MQESILQEFLEANLFNVELDDVTFSKLEVAVQDMIKKDLKKKTAIPGSLLAALDPNVSIDDPYILAAKSHITKRSNTLLSKSKDSPITLLRAILLEALWKLAHKDISFARIIWLIGSNIAPYYKLGREEETIIRSFIGNIGQIVENKAIEVWKTTDSQPISVKPIEISFPEVVINEEELLSSLKGAAGPHGSGGGNDKGTNPNRYWPNGNQNWVSDFAEKASRGIAQAITDSIEDQNTALSKIVESIKNVVNEVVDRNQKLINESNSALKNRSHLLWWKEALYSQSMTQSYRELDTEILPLIVAFDLYEEVSGIYPVSIDYFLKETLNRVVPKPEKKTIKKLLENITNFLPEHIKDEVLPDVEKSDSRETLYQFLGGMANHTYTVEENLQQKIGLIPNIELDEIELGVWLFHELQALRICNTK